MWGNLERGADDARHAMHLLTLATVGADGRPSARLMTNRGAERGPGRLWFYTRVDVPKMAELRAASAVCVVGYDAVSGVQLRVFGESRVHTRDEVADLHWEHVAEVSRWLFESADQQGASPLGVDPRFPNDKDKLTAGVSAKARAAFGVIEIKAETIDWLQATERGQLRAVLHASDSWVPVVVDRSLAP